MGYGGKAKGRWIAVVWLLSDELGVPVWCSPMSWEFQFGIVECLSSCLCASVGQVKPKYVRTCDMETLSCFCVKC